MENNGRIRIDEIAGLQYPGDFDNFVGALPKHLQPAFMDYGLCYKPIIHEGVVKVESPAGWACDVPARLRRDWQDGDYAAIENAAQNWARDMERRCNEAATAYDEVY